MNSRRIWVSSCFCAALICVFVDESEAQTRSVSGVVETMDGKRLEGVDVRITGASGGPTTEHGEFTIILPSKFKDADSVEFYVTGWAIVSPYRGIAPIPKSESCIIHVLVAHKGERFELSDSGLRHPEPKPVRKGVRGSSTKQQNPVPPTQPRQPGPQPLSDLPRKTQPSYVKSKFRLVLAKPADGQEDHQEEPTERDLRAKAKTHFSAGRYKEAESLYLKVLSINQKNHGNRDSSVAADLIDLGRVYYAQARYKEAESLDQRALSIDEEVFGGKSSRVALDLSNLGDIYYAQGNASDAELAYRRSLEINEELLGSNHPGVTKSLTDLAALYREQGDYVEAERLYLRALATRKAVPDADDNESVPILNNLAGVYYAEGRYIETEALYRKALNIIRRTAGPDHPDEAKVSTSLSQLFMREGRFDEAEPLIRRALAIDEISLGPNHPGVAKDLSNLAKLNTMRGNYEAAEPLLQRALMIEETALGPHHPDVAAALNNLAHLYKDEGQLARAEPLFQRALAIDESALGPERYNVAESLNNLASLYYSEGRWWDAEILFKRALTIDEKALGPQHPTVATDVTNLAEVYMAQGKYDIAERLYMRSLAINEKARPLDNSKIAKALTNLAAVSAEKGQYADAKSFYERALAIDEKAFKPDSPYVADICDRLAGVLRKLGQADAAKSYEDRALAIRALLPEDPLMEEAQEQREKAQLRAAQDNERPNLPYYRQQLSSFLETSDCAGAFYYAHKIFFVGPDQSEKAAFESVCGPYTLALEEGTPVKLEFQHDLTSSAAHSGDRVEFKVVDPIFVNGILVVPQGAIAWGTVVKSAEGRKVSRVGQLEIKLEGVSLADGGISSIAVARNYPYSRQSRKAKAGIVIGAILETGPALPFLLMHGKGKNVTIPAGTQVTAYVAAKVDLDPVRFTPSGPAPGIARIEAAPGVSGSSVVSFQNQSGTDVTVRLVGPSAQVLTVGDGQTISAHVASGDYYVLVRYGKAPSEYLFSKAGPVRVNESSDQHSLIHISLYKPSVDNPQSREEFYK